MNKQQSLVVIGNGMVGYKFIEKLTEADHAKHYHITTFCEEPIPAYDRVHLSDYFAGKSAADLSLAAVDWYAERDVTLLLEDAVTQIDRRSKTVTSQQGKQIAYDKLVIATGSAAFVPPIPGVDKEGVFVYRTIWDLNEKDQNTERARTEGALFAGRCA